MLAHFKLDLEHPVLRIDFDCVRLNSPDLRQLLSAPENRGKDKKSGT